MIRKSLEIGTKVFNGVYGFGIFKGWNDYGDAIIKFNEHEVMLIMRKNLTEVEDEPENNKPKNKEKPFDPPI